jgi:Cu/Ag efflux pump CusA
MLRWLIGTSLRSRGLVAVIAVGVIVLGVVQLRDMPRDSLPEFTPTRVEVQTEALGLSAEEVEQLITVPLEQDLLNGVAFLDYIRSESVPGLSRIEMTFEPGTDELEARQVVSERLVQAAVPLGIPNTGPPPQMLQPRSSTSRVMMVRLSSETESLIDLSVLARWTIRPALLSVPGVSNVTAWGERDQQLQVQVDPANLNAQGVTLDQIIRTAGNSLWVSPLTFLEASTPGSGGFFDTPSQRIGVQNIQPIKTAQDLAQIVLEAPDGAPEGAADDQRLGDVATVVEDHQPLIGDAVFADGSGLLLVVEKLPEANTLEVTRALDEKLQELAPGLQGVDVDASFFRPADYVEASGDNLTIVLIIGGVLALLALTALLFNLRRVFVALFSVLVALAAGVLILWARGETINAMVLAGLVLALVLLVDDVVANTEAAERGLTRAEGDDEPTVMGRYVNAVLATRRPLLYGTVIALVALVPIFVLTGVTGAFMPPIALSYLGAVVASLVVAYTVAPAMALLVTSRKARTAEPSRAESWLEQRSDNLGTRLTRSPAPGFVVGAVLLVVGILVVPFLDRADSLVPDLKDRDVLVQLETEPGTSLPAMRKAVARASRELRAVPGVGTVGGHVGRAILGDQTVDTNSGEIWVGIQSSADYDDTLAAVEDVVAGYPALQSNVRTYPKERIDDVLRTPDGMEGKDLTVRVFGENLDTLERQARRLRSSLAGIDGVVAPKVEAPQTDPTLQIEVDLARAEALGLKPGDVRRAAATVFSGLRVGFLFEQQKVFDVVVWGSPDTRANADAVRGLLIDLPDGSGQVRLDEVANVREVDSPNIIERKDVSRALDIGLDVDGRSVGAVASDVEDRMRDTAFPIEYHAELLDDYADRSSDRWLFIGLSIAAVLGIYLLLQAAFRSWALAALVLVALVAALSGGVVAALIDGNFVTIGSLMAFLAVFGLAARQAVLFVERAQWLRYERDGTVGPKVTGDALRASLPPTITTAVTLFVLFLPFLFFSGAGGEIVSPMAAVIIGGLVTTTVVTLAVVPALYLRFGDRTEHGEDLDMLMDLTGPAPEEAPVGGRTTTVGAKP